MNEQYEVQRLLDGNDPLQAELREALRVVSQDGPSALQIAQMTESVLSTVAAGAGVGAGVSTTTGALKWLALKSTWAKLALVFCTVGGAAWMIGQGLQGDPGPTQAGVPTEQTIPEVAQAPTATSGVRPGRADPGLPAADRGLERENAGSTDEVAAVRGDDRPVARARRGVTRRPRRRARGATTRTDLARSTAVTSRSATRGSASAPTASVGQPEEDTPAQQSPSETAPENDPTELALVGEAQRALAQQPATALTLLERHRRQYPESSYAQERDALILDALSRLGRIDELNSQAASFLARYPRSPHRQRVRELLRQAGDSAP